MTKKYRVIFQGLGEDRERFKSRMARLGVRPDSVDLMIEKAPVIMKQGLSFELSMRYANAVRKAGGIAEVLECTDLERTEDPAVSIASFTDFVMCPQCGLKQHKARHCVKCGFRLAKAEHRLESKNAAGY